MALARVPKASSYPARSFRYGLRYTTLRSTLAEGCTIAQTVRATVKRNFAWLHDIKAEKT